MSGIVPPLPYIPSWRARDFIVSGQSEAVTFRSTGSSGERPALRQCDVRMPNTHALLWGHLEVLHSTAE